MKKLLIAEDEDSIRKFIVINLKRNGYEVTEAGNGQEAIDKYEQAGGNFDIALLDIMMPEKDGTEVCRYLREKSPSIGIIMLTAKSQESDKVSGLLMGADDYIVKPFSLTELIARVDAVYRRVSVSRKAEDSKTPDDRLVSGDFKLDYRLRKLFKGEEEIELTSVEFQLMEYLMANPEKKLARKEILERVWGKDYYGDEKVVDVNVRRLRMKIEDDPSSPKHLTTVWGSGYKWIP